MTDPIVMARQLFSAIRQLLARLARVFAWPVLLLAGLAIASDLARLGTGGIAFQSLEVQWQALAPGTLMAAQKATPALIWEWGLRPLLRLPASLILFLAGASLAIAGRRRRQINIYAN